MQRHPLATSSLHSGTIPLPLTDTQASSRLWVELRSDMAPTLIRHDENVRSAIEQRSGVVVKDKGDGCFAVFVSALHAVDSVIAAQHRLRATPRPEAVGRINVGLALHTPPDS